MRDWQAYLGEVQETEQKRMRLGVERIRPLLAALDHPERAFRSVHVGGTNGKGSVTALVASVLHAAGVRAARYTSPHLHAPMERIWIAGSPISKETWVALGDEVCRGADELAEWPSPFEFMTAMGFLAFARAGVEVAVVEVGIGGRLDATNVITPLLSAITSVGHDHCRLLGRTLPEIAREKAGIIKPGIPVVLGVLPPGAARVCEGVAREAGAPVVWARSTRYLPSEGRARFVWGVGETRMALECALGGSYQRENVGVALTVLALLEERGIPIGMEAVREGLRRVNWPGRFERIREEPLVILDGAHNPQGMRALIASLSLLPTPGKRVMLVGVYEDKEIPPILSSLKRWATHLVFTRSSSPRSADPILLSARLGPFPGDVRVTLTLEEGLSTARGLLGPDDVLVVAGSLLLVGEVRELLNEEVACLR